MTMTEDLTPVRDALLRRAYADADRILAEAEAAAARRIEQADRTAADILDRARESGRLDAAAAVSERHRQARDRARDAVLAAQRGAYDELVARVVAAIEAELATDAWRNALRRRIAEELGPDAVVAELPRGGVTGSAPGRRIAIGPDQLAERGLSGGRVRELWTS